MRLLILAAVLLVIDWFSFQGVRYLIQNSDRQLRILVYALFWMVPVLSMAFVAASMNGITTNWPKALKVFLGTFIVILYLSKLLMGSVILIDDFRRLVMWIGSKFSSGSQYSLGRSKFLTQLSLGIGALPFVSLTYGLIRNPYRYKIYQDQIPILNLSMDLQGLRIVQISDIHSGSFLHKEPVIRSVEMINELKPDIVFFTGDLVNSKADEMDDFIDVFDKIEAPHGVYSILGNHDYGDYHTWPSEEAKRDNFEYLKRQHEKLGWTLLLNENAHVQVGDSTIGIIGVENYSASKRFHKYGDMAKSLEGLKPSELKILLSHDPSHWTDQVITEYSDVDLTLSGHTHGFQFGVEIPGFLKWSPAQYMYKQWAGLYQKGQQFLYVNRGLGFLGYPGRVGILPEITLLTLKKSN
jgi:uncharacterized protein